MARFRCRSCGNSRTSLSRRCLTQSSSTTTRTTIDDHAALDPVGFRKIRVNRYVERFRPPHALARHRESRAFLEAELRNRRGVKLVVATHHAPMPGRAYRLGHHYPGSRLSDEEVLTAAYRSDLTELMWPAPIADGKNALRPADLWIHGHTHESEDVTIGHTRIVSNAKGYGPWLPKCRGWDNPRFDPNFVIEI